MQGTPVKSCMITRAGVNWISLSGSASASQPASARMWSAVMSAPSSVRSRFSSRTLRLNGRLRLRRREPVAGDRVQPVDLVGLAAYVERALRRRSCPGWPSRLLVEVVVVAPTHLAAARGGVEGRV